MSEKYTRVYHSTDLMYAESSPVIVMARALLKDNGAGGIFTQLKFKSISDKIIKAAKVKIIPLDITGTLIGDAVEHTYLDLNISRNQEFGSKEIVSISEITARAFNVSIKQVVFADNSVWEYDGNEYQKIDNLIPLNKKISNPELIKQYKIELGDDSSYVPMKIKDLWVCTCGNYNHIGGEKCKNCGRVFEKEIELLDLNILQEKYKERLERETEEKRVAEEKQRIADEEKQVAAEKNKKKIKKAIAISAPIICAMIAFIVVLNTVIIPKQKSDNAYNKAMEYMDKNDYQSACKLLNGLNYKDSEEKQKESASMLREVYSIIDRNRTISAGDRQTIGLKSDGTVVAVGSNYCGQCNVSSWQDIVAVSTGDDHTVGLRQNGSVVATKFIWNGPAGFENSFNFGQYNVSDWVDIVAVSAGNDHTVGLKSDGTVVAVGDNRNGQCDVSDWADIVAISAGECHTVGLKSDGTVVATHYTGAYYKGQCNVSNWTDIVAISAGNWHTVGLKSDGTVVVVGDNYEGQCDVSGWVDIVAISAGGSHTVGLKLDGTVVAVGENGLGACNVSDWTDIVAISAGGSHTAGLKSDGTVVAVGNNLENRCNVSGWSNIALPPTNEQIAEVLKNK